MVLAMLTDRYFSLSAFWDIFQRHLVTSQLNAGVHSGLLSGLQPAPLRATVAGGPRPGAEDVAGHCCSPFLDSRCLPLPLSPAGCPAGWVQRAGELQRWISAHLRQMRLCNSFGMREDVFWVISTAFLFCVTWSFRTTHLFRSSFSWTKIFIKI